MAPKPFRLKYTVRCDSAEPNDGINKLLFTRRGSNQDEPWWGNSLKYRGAPIVGMHYWFEIYPAYPTDDVREQKTRPRIGRARRRASSPKLGRDHMAKHYQGKTVTVVRDARAGDVGFDQNKDQILIRVDNAEKVVLRTEVTDAP